jgi:tetratricopeptide (TPR) repeat protein
MDGESGVSLLLIGDAYLAEKNFDKALEYYEKAKKEDTLAISQQRIAQTYLTMPKPDEDKAQASLEVAVHGLLSSGERRLAAESAVKLAGIYAKKNRPEEFRNVLQTAKNADPTYAPPYAMIGCNIDISKPEGKEAAKTNCEKYVQLDPRGEYATACQEVLRKVK